MRKLRRTGWSASQDHSAGRWYSRGKSKGPAAPSAQHQRPILHGQFSFGCVVDGLLLPCVCAWDGVRSLNGHLAPILRSITCVVLAWFLAALKLSSRFIVRVCDPVISLKYTLSRGTPTRFCYYNDYHTVRPEYGHYSSRLLLFYIRDMMCGVCAHLPAQWMSVD